MRYLDPKTDLTFKKVFGEHPDLMISLLNALLPLKIDQEVIDIEYMTPEMVPENPLSKNSIVDVRCFDKTGRQFLVEMQMEWTQSFTQRILFNASKAYVRQLGKGDSYSCLNPVYSLSFVNAIFEPDYSGWYHHYSLVHNEKTQKVIEGLQLIFVELPKFKPQTFSGKKMQVLWLRFLTEIAEDIDAAPADLLENPDINKALSCVQESAFTRQELEIYDKYWDIVSTERTLIYEKSEEAVKKGIEQGIQQGIQQGIEQGIQQGIKRGIQQGVEQGIAKGVEQGIAKGIEQGMVDGIKEGVELTTISMVKNAHAEGFSVEMITKITGLSFEKVQCILLQDL